jgi:hypothetical protein
MRAVLARLQMVAVPVMRAFAHRPTNANGAGDSMRELCSRLAILAAGRLPVARLVVIESYRAISTSALNGRVRICVVRACSG